MLRIWKELVVFDQKPMPTKLTSPLPLVNHPFPEQVKVYDHFSHSVVGTGDSLAVPSLLYFVLVPLFDALPSKSTVKAG